MQRASDSEEEKGDAKQLAYEAKLKRTQLDGERIHPHPGMVQGSPGWQDEERQNKQDPSSNKTG